MKERNPVNLQTDICWLFERFLQLRGLPDSAEGDVRIDQQCGRGA